MNYPKDFKDYGASSLNEKEINHMLQNMIKFQAKTISSGNILIIRYTDDDEILICKVLKSNK